MLHAEEFEGILQRHVLDAWFPRCMDLTHGGFLCDFDRAWVSCGPHQKLLEFQARQTMTAADACRRYPGEQRFHDASVHGLRYLLEVMWDGAHGGWFHRLERAGQPLEAHTKHAHGAAYAIQACVAVHEATGHPAALPLAQRGFDWLDRCARDRDHGGYFGFLQRNGSVIRTSSECPWTSETDTIGTEIGLKDANVHSDLLEALVHLYRAWPEPRVGERLAEVLDIVSDKLLVPSTGRFTSSPPLAPQAGPALLAPCGHPKGRRLEGCLARRPGIAVLHRAPGDGVIGAARRTGASPAAPGPHATQSGRFGTPRVELRVRHGRPS